MAKRKLGVSVIILCIAAVTLISGTYAWFLVGGFAELFDIGFDVIEATGGILLRGDAGTYGGGKTDNEGWGTSLDREDFSTMSFIVQGGRYKPVSTNNGTNFISVSMEGEKFICNGIAPSKSVSGTTAEDICYNDFTFSIKSTGEEIPAGAFIKIKLSGEKYDEAGNVVDDDKVGAATAARVSITTDSATTIYSYDGEGYEAVTNTFTSGSITDDHENYIIDNGDTGYANAGLAAVTSPALMDTDGNEVKISLGRIPGFEENSRNGKPVTIRIWLEGNDPQCIAFGEGAVAGKTLTANISFGVDE
jgi:hypothetical protein